MDIDKKDGGPAFPDPGRAQSAKQRETITETGMSLRDYFAAKAMQGFLSHPDNIIVIGKNGELAKTLVATSYEVADAMLKAREE